MDAMRLPKGTPEQAEARAQAVEQANKQAAEVPLGTARLCLDALRLAARAAERGNVNSASDAGVAALAARAGVEGAVLNVRINLGAIADEAFKAACTTEAQRLVADARQACDDVQTRVVGTFSA
jgi:formiminotetrahydrofolate cyclodeaminase